LRDCRKSPKMPNLPISHSMKSISYKHQNRKFRVFRQSLRVPQLDLDCRYPKYHNFSNRSDLADMLEISQVLQRFQNLWYIADITCFGVLREPHNI